MIEVAIMIEGQNGLNWPRWQRMVEAVEGLGFAGLYRSDHFTNGQPPDKDSLELWVSLAWLASHTTRIEFGPLVTPFSFRHPVFTARTAKDVDDLSHGRLTLGVGAGWQAREHALFGFDLLDIPARFARFEEGLEVIRCLMYGSERVTFEGEYYQLRDAQLLPRPQRAIPLLIGGNGLKRTLPLVARYADEWNAVYLPASKFAELNHHLDDLLVAEGRASEYVRRSMMTGLEFGRSEAEVKAKVEARAPGRSAEELRTHGLVVGTANEVVEQLGKLAEVGVQRVMLQWLDLDDLDGLASLATGVLGQV